MEDVDAVSVGQLVGILKAAAMVEQGQQEYKEDHEGEDDDKMKDVDEPEEKQQQGEQQQQQQQQQQTKTCAVCEAPADKRCSRCRSIFYCTPEHQRSHWKTHKTACQKRPKEGPSPSLSSSPSSSSSSTKKLKAEDYFPKMQALLMQPGGIQKVLVHPTVVELRNPQNEQSTQGLRMLFDNLEGGNLMGALMGLGDPTVKAKLMDIAPRVVEDLGL